jgi:hypothetical protein
MLVELHGLASENPVPVTVTLPTVSAVFPLFRIVTVPLPDSPTFTVPNASPVALSSTARIPPVAVPVTVNWNVPEDPPSLCVKLTVALFCPSPIISAVGENCTVNDVLPSAATELDGCAVTENPLSAVTPTVPSVNAAVPVFATVNVFVCAPAVTAQFPNATVPLFANELPPCTLTPISGVPDDSARL